MNDITKQTFWEKLKEVFIKRWYVVLYFVAMFIVCILIATHNNYGEDNRYAIKSEQHFENKWEYDFLEGTTGYTDLPADLPNVKSSYLVLKNTLPKVTDYTSFFYRVRHTTLRVYVGGELRYDTKTKHREDGAWEDLIGIYDQEIFLTESDSGKEIVIEITSTGGPYINHPGYVYLGDRGSLVLSKINNKYPTLICTIILGFLSIVLFILWAMFRFLMKQSAKEVVCLALFSFSVGCWLFSESTFAEFIFKDMGKVSIIAYESIMLMPVPIALYFVYYSDRERGIKFSKIASIIPLVLFAVNNLLHFFGIAKLAQTMKVSQIVLAVETIFIAIIQIIEIKYKYKHRNEYRMAIWIVPMIGILILAPLALVEIVKYLFFSTKFSNDGILITIGVLFYLLALAFDSVIRLNYRTIKFKESSEVKTQFLANMSHEMRTPLNAILGFNEMVLRVAKDEKIIKYSQNIQEAGDNLKSIINSVLDISKIESGKLEVYSVEYSTVQVIDNVISMAEALAKKKGLEVITDIDENLPEILIGDEKHIIQVVNNLMNNAVKYTPEGTVTLSIRVVEMMKDMPLCKLRVAVMDTGIGIKPEDRERLFEKFERLDREKNYSTEGTGLGMSIVIQLLHAMDSEIQLESEYGKGSTFSFEIIQSVTDKKNIGSFIQRRKELVVENKHQAEFKAPDAKILVVDDVQMNLDTACALLEQIESKVDTALSGKEAFEMIKEKRYNLVLMDHMMPEWDGIVTCEKIREYSVEAQDVYFAEVPIIALTANAIVGMKEQFLMAGMQDFVSKPIEVSSLNAALKKWLPKELVIKITPEMRAKESAIFMENPNMQWQQLPGCVDVETAKHYCPTYELFERNLKSFANNFEQTRDKLSKFKAENDVDNYTITVHGLKSTSKMTGLLGISEIALEQEEKCQGGMAEEVWPETEKLLDLYEQCTKEIRHFLGIEDTIQVSNVSIMTNAEYDALRNSIKEAAENFDMGAFMEFEEELEKVVPPEEKKEEFEIILNGIRNTAFGELTDYFASH